MESGVRRNCPDGFAFCEKKSKSSHFDLSDKNIPATMQPRFSIYSIKMKTPRASIAKFGRQFSMWSMINDRKTIELHLYSGSLFALRTAVSTRIGVDRGLPASTVTEELFEKTNRTWFCEWPWKRWLHDIDLVYRWSKIARRTGTKALLWKIAKHIL